jgi:integrase/recombinase XerD
MRKLPKAGPRKARRLPGVLTAAEVKKLMSTPNMRVPTGFRDRCIMQLMHRCGLRIREACGVRLGDVDWETGFIRVIAETAKGRRERTVYADPATLELLTRWLEMRGRYSRTRKDDAPLFISIRRGACSEAGDVPNLGVTTSSVYKSIRRRMLKAGIADETAHPHTLRHTFATDSLGHGVSIVKLQQLMGHASITTTTIYLHVNDPELAAEMKAIHWNY